MPSVIVVGAGSAGCVLAARLAERFAVTLLEAGPAILPEREPSSAPPAWSLSAQLSPTRRWTAMSGRAVGGSSVAGGGYFAPPEARDLELWHAVGGPAWDPRGVRSRFADMSERLGVQPSPSTHPVTRAFVEACEQAGEGEGLLRLGTSIDNGSARNVATAFLAHTAVTVRADCRALRVVVQDGRAVGVEVADADGTREVLTSDEVVLCAGGFGTTRVLLASGLGPRDALCEAGIAVVADLPGVGAAFSDHPTVWVEWVPTPALAARTLRPESDSGAFPLALRCGADGGAGDDLEILVCTQPPDPADPSTFGVIVGLQRPRSRGTVVPASTHPFAGPRIEYHYLEDRRDRSALRAGVRAATAIVASRPFEALVDRLVDLDDETLGDDERLDAWIEDRLGSAAHTCASAPMGSESDPLAVVDGAGRVRGVSGLRIADTSILPVVPSRAPAAAAMIVGVIIAEQMCE